MNYMGAPIAPLAVQLYSLREEAKRDLGAVLERVAEIGYLGVEMIWLHGMSAAELRSRLDDLGLELVGWHLELPDEDHYKASVAGLDVQQELGNDTVLASLDELQFESVDSMRRAIDRFNRLAAEAQDRGMRLGYHNHWWEFTTSFEGKSAMSTLLQEFDPRIFVEPDTYWIEVGTGDLTGTLERFGSRARLLHLKDGPCNQTDPMTAVGAGKMDIPAAIAAMPQSEWHIVELDECGGDMFEAVEASYRYLVSNGLSRGRDSKVNA